MKKFLAILFLGFLLCSNALALTVDEAIKKFFTDRKLDPIEGIWIHKEGFTQAFVKEGRNYYRYMIEHKYDHIWPSGSKGEYPIRKTSTEKVYADQATIYNLENIDERATGGRTLIIENINFIKIMYSRGCWSQGRCWTPWESHYIRNWPDDFHSHNASIKDENESVVRWHKVAISKDKELTSYVDRKSMKKRGDIVFFTQLDSLKKGIVIEEGTTAYSAIVKLEGNCTNNAMRFLKSVYYQKNMAKGKIIYTDNSISEWERYEPGTVLGIVLDYVCTKTKTKDFEEENVLPDSSEKESEDDWF